MERNTLLYKNVLILLCGFFFCGLAVSCASSNYIERDYDKNLQKLMECPAYEDEVGTGGTTGTAAGTVFF